MNEKFSLDLDLKIFIAITIAIENLIRIDRDPIFILKLDPNFSEKSHFDSIGFDALGSSAEDNPRRVGIPALRWCRITGIH